jgi:uncharacterized protein (DUF924 family)
MDMTNSPEAVLAFWFGELDEQGRAAPDVTARWFKKDEAFDAEIRERFAGLHAALASGERDGWTGSPRARLATIIVLDQLSRNMFRGTPGMFATDPLALAATHEGLERGDDRALRLAERVFFYMPLMHSEALADQERCIELFRALAGELEGEAKKGVENNVEYAVRHRDIVARFGRFPHRNAILGRASSEEELAFLQQPGSSF